MGRRPQAQKTIIKCLTAGRKRWSELYKETGLGKGPFVNGLNELLKRKVVRSRLDSSKRPTVRYYELNRVKLQSEAARRGLFSIFAMEIFDDLDRIVREKSHSDVEVLEKFCGKIGLLALYTFLTGLSVHDAEETLKWIKEAFATTLQRYQILSMLSGRLCLGEMKFEDDPNAAVETVRKGVAWSKDEGFYITFETPEDVWFNPTTMSLVKSKLPQGRIDELKAALRTLYPDEVNHLEKLESTDFLFDKFLSWMIPKKDTRGAKASAS